MTVRRSGLIWKSVFLYLRLDILSPTDVIYMTIVLIICALALFLFTAVAGVCGAVSLVRRRFIPEIFMWIERKIEVIAPRKLRLHKAPWRSVKSSKSPQAWFVDCVFIGSEFYVGGVLYRCTRLYQWHAVDS